MGTRKPELENDPLIKFFNLNTKVTVLSQLFYPMFGVCLGVGAFMMRNASLRRPILTGFQLHIAGGLTGGYLGHLAEEYHQKKFAERDAVIRHYMSLHPDDFAPKEKVLYKDVMQSWAPVR